MERLKIRPRGNRVLVDVLFDITQRETVANLMGGKAISGSSLVAPEIVTEEIKTPTDRAIVMRYDETKIEDLKEGDVAIFNERVGTKLTYQGHTFLLLNDVDVYAVLED